MISQESELYAQAQARVGSVILGKYRIDRVLGMGGMAVVYAATHRNRTRFAVKMLHAELSVQADIRGRFLREGYVANSVEHKGAVKVLDDDVADDGAAFLVMELLDGESVERVCERSGQRLPVAAALAVAYQALDVLAAAHAHSVVHRDIKPANLFLTREGQVKVLDFGIARLRESTSTGSTQGGILGTPSFMAPEQALGRSQEVDGRTDVWAVGATLFSLLAGAPVHVGESAQEVLVLAATRPARSLATVVPDVPPRVVALVDRATAFERDRRWSGAAEMRDAAAAAYLECVGSAVSEAPLLALFEPGTLVSGPPPAVRTPSAAPGLASGTRTYAPPAAVTMPRDRDARGIRVLVLSGFALASVAGGAGVWVAMRAPAATQETKHDLAAAAVDGRAAAIDEGSVASAETAAPAVVSSMSADAAAAPPAAADAGVDAAKKKDVVRSGRDNGGRLPSTAPSPAAPAPAPDAAKPHS